MAGPPITEHPRVAIVEVGPRDGLQSLEATVPTPDKLVMIERLLEAGITRIETTSFVHPRVVPQLADAEAVMAQLTGPSRPAGVQLRALVPNRRGAERAIAAGADVLLALLSASGTYTARNQNMTGDEAIAQVREIAELARASGVGWAAAISMAFGSPYEPSIPEADVLALVGAAAELEPTDLYLADTVGWAQPAQVASLVGRVREGWPGLRLGVHLHGDGARGLACAVAAVRAGAVQVESAILGLGGPIVRSPNTPLVGNLPTEWVVGCLTDLGIDPGLDPDRVWAAAVDVAARLGLDGPVPGPPVDAVAALLA